jgi:Tfp pilus assembly protein PilO
MTPEQPLESQAITGRRKIPVRMGPLRRTPVLSVIGIAELVGLACAALLALITLFAYFYFFIPSHSRLNSARLERERLQGQLQASQKNVQDTTSTSDAVNKINTSLEDFETNWLAARDTGRMSLYTTLNNLIRTNGLRNTAGPSYTTLDPLGTKQQVQPTASAEKQSNAKWQTIYPGIAVSVTVEGPYQNVWHFVRDIETSRHFLIINAVELESVTHSAAVADAGETAPRLAPRNNRAGEPAAADESLPKGRGDLVSLRLDLTTYFRRTASDEIQNGGR